MRDQGSTLGRPKPWDWHKDAKGRSCAYVSIDAICVAQQAKGGGKAEGRMPYVAMIYNPIPDLPKTEETRLVPPAAARPSGVAARQQARYLSGLYSLDKLGPPLRKQAAQVGMEWADLWIALTDGGNGLEDFLRENFGRPDLVVILDFWHVAEYLADLAKARAPGGRRAVHGAEGPVVPHDETRGGRGDLGGAARAGVTEAASDGGQGV